MGLKGYCSNCTVLVDMVGVQTIRLSNKQYVQSGSCPNCQSPIIKAIPDSEMLVVPPGQYCPQTVYVGKDTPSKIINDQNGQQIINGDSVVTTTPKNKDIKTLAQIEEELDEKQNTSTNDQRTADSTNQG